jgi:hypothetical protein
VIANPLILPENVAIDDPRVQFELTRYLSDNRVPVIERDVDGPHALPLRLDREVPNLGRKGAQRLGFRCVAFSHCQPARPKPTIDSQSPNDTRTANRTQTTHALIRVLQDIRRTEENTGVGLKIGALAIAGLITAPIWAQKIVRTMP